MAQVYSARRSGRAIAFSGTFILTMVVLWAMRHLVRLYDGHASAGTLAVIYALTFATLAWQVVAYMFERPYKTTEEQDRQLDKLRVVANVPVCNEDPEALKQCLLSMAFQTRRIDQVQVVVNGPNKVDYREVKLYAKQIMESYGLPISWVTQEVAGKRHAQARTARTFLKPGDIFLTVDSDAYLDAHAVEEGLKPFAYAKVMSVAGVCLTLNNRASFMTRMTDLLFQTWQMTDRSAASTFGAVLVNSGVVALYRGSVILDNLEGYTNESFFGRPVQFSDDSMLTLYALQKGAAVQQPTVFAFTLMPENLSHHLRQQVRWSRGSFIRSWWRFKYLPLKSYAYWSHLFRWMQVIISAFTFFYIWSWSAAVNRHMLPYLFVVPLAIGYAQALRYFTISRSDESFWYRLATWLCQPIPGLWSLTVLRFIRYYGIATCLKTGWGTRQEVEVGMSPASIVE